MKFINGGMIGASPSGSQGSVTASHNRGGYYLRTRTIPTNPNTIRQQAVRAIFGSLVQAWTNALTAGQRALWEAYAAAVPLTNTLGEPIIVSGQNMYLRSNTPRLQMGGARIDTAPTTLDTGSPVTLFETSTDATANALGINMGGTALDATLYIDGGASDDGDVLLYIGPPINATRTFFKGPYQLMATVAVTSTDPSGQFSTAAAAALNSNGFPIADQNRGCRARVMYDDGRLSQAYEAILPVVAASA